MTVVGRSGAGHAAAPVAVAAPATMTVTYRGVAWVVDLAGCRRALRARATAGGPDPVEAVAEAVEAHPEVVRRFLQGHLSSPRLAVRIAVELAGRHDTEPPRGAGGTR